MHMVAVHWGKMYVIECLIEVNMVQGQQYFPLMHVEPYLCHVRTTFNPAATVLITIL